MTPEEFDVLYPSLAAWIENIVAAHKPNAQTVGSVGFKRLPSYFSERLLSSASCVSVPKVPVPPLSAMGLQKFAEFENGNYGGITYLDTFFIRRDLATQERLYFHELIHVVQWAVLGRRKFLAAYAEGLEVYGYRDSPLEKMAYSAEETFANSPEPFNAEQFVLKELDKLAAPWTII